MTFEQFAEKHGITLRAESAPANPNMAAGDWTKGASHWYCTLECEARRMSLHYSMGSGHRRFARRLLAREAVDQLPRKKGERVPHGWRAYGREADNAIEPIPPTAAGVLECLHSEASYADCDLDTFAEELFSDGGKLSKIIRAHVATHRNIGELRAVLGPLWGEFESVDGEEIETAAG